MGVEYILIGLILVCGFYVAWNIGANDVANAMGTSVGSGALTLRRAVLLAAVFEFAGAFIVGSNVSETIRKGMFEPDDLIEKVVIEAPNAATTSSLKYLVEHGAAVKTDQPLMEYKTGEQTIVVHSPATGHFSKKEIPVSESAAAGKGKNKPAPTFKYAIELNRDVAPYILACGMISALLAAGTWLLIATWMHWPVSTTHSIVGAVVGFGCLALGFDGVQWDKIILISAGWIVSPLISGTIAYLLFGILLRNVFFKRDPVAAAKRAAPWLTAITLFVMTAMTAYKGMSPLWKRMGLDDDTNLFKLAVFGVAVLLGGIGWLVTKRLMRNFKRVTPSGANPVLDAEVSRSLGKTIKHLQRVRNHSSGEVQAKAEQMLGEVEQMQDVSLNQIKTNTDSAELQQVEKIFVILQILTACFVAFAHGANDVANAIGPLSAAFQAVSARAIEAQSVTPWWALLLGGTGIVIGLATWGWKVIKTVGERITELTPSRGFCAEFAASITILMASVLPIGLPISTTHTLVGAVLGVGLARGINALNLRTMRDIVAGWAITIPAGAVLAMLFYFILKMIFIDSGWVDELAQK